MRYFLIAVLMLSCSLTWASNVVVTGHVSNDLARVIKLEVNQRYLNDNVVLYESAIENGKFMFDVDLADPQLVRLKYAQNVVELYLEPNSSLHIEFSANTFKHGMRFSGNCGLNNKFLQNYQKNFPEERNQFNMVQFKKGVVSYKVPRNMEQKMLNMTTQDFRREQETLVLKKESSLSFFQQNNGSCTEAFKQFIWAEIQYDKAYHMLVYGHAFGGRHGIKDDYFSFMNEVPLKNELALGNKKYQKYALGALNYFYMKNVGKTDMYAGQYKLAGDHFSVRCLSFVRSELIYRAIKRDELDAIIPVYQKFLETNPSVSFDQKINDAYNEASRYAVGMPVPDFELTDINGNTVRLEDYKGKVVYLNFWATWCRPCLSKLSRLQTLEKEINNRDIIFLHVSFDRKEANWRATVNNNNFGGTHVFAEGDLNSEIAKAYNIKAIPDFYVITKKGRFAARPMTSDMLELKSLLERLNALP